MATGRFPVSSGGRQCCFLSPAHTSLPHHSSGTGWASQEPPLSTTVATSQLLCVSHTLLEMSHQWLSLLFSYLLRQMGHANRSMLPSHPFRYYLAVSRSILHFVLICASSHFSLHRYNIHSSCALSISLPVLFNRSALFFLPLFALRYA